MNELVTDYRDPELTAGFNYLSSPYSHADASIRLDRYQAAVHATARLLAHGHVVFSPIVHGVGVETELASQAAANQIELTHAWWMAQCLPMLDRASRLLVLKIRGWEMSRGVALEMRHAKQYGIPVEFVHA